MGSHRTYSIPGKTVALIPEFAVEDLPSAELQPKFLRVKLSTCSQAEHSDNDDDDDDGDHNSKFYKHSAKLHKSFLDISSKILIDTVYVCGREVNANPLHFTCFGIRAMLIDGVNMVYFIFK